MNAHVLSYYWYCACVATDRFLSREEPRMTSTEYNMICDQLSAKVKMELPWTN